MITLQLDPTLMGNPQIDALSNLILSFRKDVVSVKTGEIQMTVGDHAVEPYVMTGNESVAKLDVIADLQNQQDDHDATQSFAEQPYVDPYDISPATAAFGDIELDSANQPWNAEIHSASKSKVADGTWRIKRGVKVDAPPAPPVPSAPAVIAPPPVVEVPPAPTTIAPPPVTAAPTDGPTFDPSVQGYVKLVQYTAGATHSGHISEPEIAMLCSQHGIASLALLTTKLDIVPTIGAQIVGIVASRAA